MTTFDLPLDKGVERFVNILIAGGVETYESCEGGPGHSYPEPTIRFHGDRAAGFRALAVALEHNLPIKDLRRIWVMVDGELQGPTWELTFWCDSKSQQENI